MAGFATEYGRAFYGIDAALHGSGNRPRGVCILERKPFTLPQEIKYTDDQGNQQTLVPYKAGQTLNFTITN